jgi:transcriptional antiterminator RfaH
MLAFICFRVNRGKVEMPILPPEPFILPENLLEQPFPAVVGECCWWVLHTRPRAEKSLARRALDQGLPFFLPLYNRQWQSRGRLFSSHLPLFPGYLFVFGDYYARLESLRTNLVAQALPVIDQARLHEDLRRVYHLMVSGVPLSPEERLQPGDLVEVTAGPLIGIGGKVLRRGKKLKLFVEVHLLQQGVSVELESWMIRPLESREMVAPPRE